MKNSELSQRASAIDRRDFLKIGAGGSALAMTALSSPAAFAQTGKNQSGSIDIHSHWLPEPYAKALAQLRPSTAPAPNVLNHDLDKRRQWMDQHGVQMIVLTLSGGMPWQWVPSADGARLAQIVNDAAIEAHLKFPDRFIGGIELPVKDIELSLKELNRVAGKPGMRAVHLPNSFEGRDYLFEPAHEPLWRAARNWDIRCYFIRSMAMKTSTRKRPLRKPASPRRLTSITRWDSHSIMPRLRPSLLLPAHWTNFRTLKLCCPIPAGASVYRRAGRAWVCRQAV